MRGSPAFSARHNTRASLRRSAVAADVAGAPAPRRSAPHTFRAAVLALVAGAAVAACAQADAEGASLRFPGSAPSLEVMAGQVVAALQRGDTTTLALFRLTEEEHNGVVWPELPASAPEVNFPLDYAWQNIEQRNRVAVSRQLSHFRGQDATFQRVACKGGVQEFRTFRVHTDCWVVLRGGGDGGLYQVQLFKDALERDGGFKLFRYYDEAPEPYRGGPLP